MLLTFVLAIESLSRAVCGLERLAGFDTTPMIRNAYLSRTVSEFWRRYNDRIHDWLYRNVFQAIGGRRAPVRSLLLVFLVSGLFHEVAFAMATSRLTGYQFAFFTIQGPAALASGASSAWPVEGGLRARSRPTGPRSSSSPSRPSSSSTGSARSSPSSMPARRRCRSMQGLDSRRTAR